MFLLPQGEDGEVICAQVKARADHFDQEQQMFPVSLGEGQATDIMTYDDIIKRLDTQLQRKSKLKDKGQLLSFREITDSHIIKGTN